MPLPERAAPPAAGEAQVLILVPGVLASPMAPLPRLPELGGTSLAGNGWCVARGAPGLLLPKDAI